MFEFVKKLFRSSSTSTSTPVVRPVAPAFALSTEYAMKVSAVYSAVKLISEGIASLPVELERWNASRGCYVTVHNSPLSQVLRLAPSGTMTAFELWRGAIRSILLEGNAYLYPRRNVVGEVVELVLLSPNSVVYDIYSKIYTISDPVNGINATCLPSEIVHLRNIGFDGGQTGRSTISLAAEALGIAHMSDGNLKETLSRGGRMRGLLTGTSEGFGSAGEEQLESMALQVERHIDSGRNVVPVSADMKFQPFTLSPADARVLESKQVTVRDIARFFRVHPDLLYEGSNNTYRAAEIPNVMFLNQTLRPLLVQIESELLVKLLPRTLWGRQRIRFDREAMYSTDLSTESLYYEKMLQTGIYSVNDLRRKKGLPAVEGGDTLLVSANLSPLSTITQKNVYTEQNSAPLVDDTTKKGDEQSE